MKTGLFIFIDFLSGRAQRVGAEYIIYNIICTCVIHTVSTAAEMKNHFYIEAEANDEQVGTQRNIRIKFV